ncbi:MAG: hypothetical protein ABI763_08245 [Bacteroidota bacterium]
MRKATFYTLLVALAAANIFTSCNSDEKKVEDAKENVQEAKQDLQDAKTELNAEYPAFKADAEVKIAENEKRITELKEKLAKPGTATFDGMRQKRIEQLEQKNADLRSKLYAYEKEHSDWETFKREFKHDMDGIGEAFKDIGKDNTK